MNVQCQRSDKKCQELQNELSVAMDRNQHILKELTAKDEALVLLKVEVASLQEKLKSRTDEVSSSLSSSSSSS